MGRFYSIPITNTGGTAGTSLSTTAVDLIEITAASGKPFLLHELVISQSSDYADAQAEGVGVFLKRGIGHTAGSGGQSVTPVKHQSSDTAAGATAKVGNSTQAVAGGGSLTLARSEAFNEQSGYQYLPPPEQRIMFAATDALVVSLFGTLADAVTFAGVAVIEEMG